MNQDKSSVKILDTIARRYGITVDDLLGKRKNATFIKARGEAAYIFRIHLKWSYPRIGFIMGKDHTTIIHSFKRFNPEELKNIEDFDFLDSVEVTRELTTNERMEKNGFYIANVKGGGRWSSVFAERGGVCEIIGCGFNEVLEIHHFVSKKVGGTDGSSNLFVVCPNHHALIHAGLVRLSPKSFPHLDIPKHLCTVSL